MKGLYQLLSEDYREYQLKESIREDSKKLIESTRPSKLAKQKALKEAAKRMQEKKLVKESEDNEEIKETVTEEVKEEILTESCKDDSKDKEVIKGSEKEDKKTIVKEDEESDEPAGSDVSAEEIIDEPAEEPTVEVDVNAINTVAALSTMSVEDIQSKIAELPEEDAMNVEIGLKSIRDKVNQLYPVEEIETAGEDTEEIPEDLTECEISSFKVTRIAPKFGAVMIEAQTKEGLKYITGKNFNEADKTLDEAEIAVDKTEASNRFKSLLK